MVDSQCEAYERDRNVWDPCARDYEDQIVCGHPDIVAYEAFEEDFLDRLMLFLVRERGRSIHLFDVGCGSGRLHLRYGLKTTSDVDLDPDSAEKLRRARQSVPGSEYDALLAHRLRAVRGLDFSDAMIKLAEKKLAAAGLGASMSGIAIISAYRKEAVETFALGNYESTMNVCGQPLWLEPDTYAGSSYIQVPRSYERAHSKDQMISVDVIDQKHQLVKEEFVLRRNEAAVHQVIETGHIETHSDYESHWYSFEEFEKWIDKLWPRGQSYHLVGKSIDALRAEPAQIAILDAGGCLKGLLNRWQAL